MRLAGLWCFLVILTLMFWMLCSMTDMPTITIPSRLWAVLSQDKNNRSIYTLQIIQSSTIYLQFIYRILVYTAIWLDLLSSNAVREEMPVSKSASIAPLIDFTHFQDYQNQYWDLILRIQALRKNAGSLTALWWLLVMELSHLCCLSIMKKPF